MEEQPQSEIGNTAEGDIGSIPTRAQIIFIVMKKIEKKVATAILQTPLTITLGGVVYDVPQPTIGTLVMASARISQLPTLELDADKLLSTVLASAKDCKCIGEIVGILILGAKEIKERARKTPTIFHKKKTEEDIIVSFGEKILNNSKPSEVVEAIMTIFKHAEIADFFQLTTFLQGVNLTKPTKVA